MRFVCQNPALCLFNRHFRIFYASLLISLSFGTLTIRKISVLSFGMALFWLFRTTSNLRWLVLSRRRFITILLFVARDSIYFSLKLSIKLTLALFCTFESLPAIILAFLVNFRFLFTRSKVYLFVIIMKII